MLKFLSNLIFFIFYCNFVFFFMFFETKFFLSVFNFTDILVSPSLKKITYFCLFSLNISICISFLIFLGSYLAKFFNLITDEELQLLKRFIYQNFLIILILVIFFYLVSGFLYLAKFVF